MKPLRPSRAATRRAGFSLAELMVVIVIIGLLATLVVPNVVEKLFTSSVTIAKADVMTIDGALNQYALDNRGQYPDALQALVTPDENGRTYLDTEVVPTDPWGHEYGYEPPGTSHPTKPVVICYGADGTPGGEGKNQDFTNLMIKNKEF